MDISLRQLEALVRVVENRSFSKAGEELFLSQSTVSSHIARLEGTLGTRLLQRQEKKNIEITEEGMRAYRAAVQILQQAEALENMFRQEESSGGLISIAASTIPSRYILPQIIAQYSALHPGCRFSILSGDSAFALDRLMSGEAAFAFVGTRSRKGLFAYYTLCRDRIVLITPNTPEFAEKQQEGVLGKALLSHPIIMRESGSGTRKETDAYLNGIGINPAGLRVAAYMNDMEAIKRMVANGGGITILSERAANDAIRDKRVLCFPLEDEGPYRDISFAHLKTRCFTPAEQAFLAFVRRFSFQQPSLEEPEALP